MNTDLAIQWSAALRSGEYKQGKDRLHDPDNNTYCCLGVLCHIEGKPTEGTIYPELVNPAIHTCTGFMPQWRFHDEKTGSRYVELAAMNDDGWTFDEIADIIDGLIYTGLIEEL